MKEIKKFEIVTKKQELNHSLKVINSSLLDINKQKNVIARELAYIYEKKLFTETHKSFDKFCVENFGMAKSTSLGLKKVGQLFFIETVNGMPIKKDINDETTGGFNYTALLKIAEKGKTIEEAKQLGITTSDTVKQITEKLTEKPKIGTTDTDNNTDNITDDNTDNITDDNTDNITDDNTDNITDDNTDNITDDNTDNITDDNTDNITDYVIRNIPNNVDELKYHIDVITELLLNHAGQNVEIGFIFE